MLIQVNQFIINMALISYLNNFLLQSQGSFVHAVWVVCGCHQSNAAQYA
jgi:hypothetical protein